MHPRGPLELHDPLYKFGRTYIIRSRIYDSQIHWETIASPIVVSETLRKPSGNLTASRVNQPQPQRQLSLTVIRSVSEKPNCGVRAYQTLHPKLQLLVTSLSERQVTDDGLHASNESNACVYCITSEHLSTAHMSDTVNSAANEVPEEVVVEQLALEDAEANADGTDNDDAPVSQPARID